MVGVSTNFKKVKIKSIIKYNIIESVLESLLGHALRAWNEECDVFISSPYFKSGRELDMQLD